MAPPMTREQSEQIEQCYLSCYRPLLAYARAALGREALAEEAVQETFGIVCRKPEEFLAAENRRAWVYQVLKYVIQNQRRVQARAERFFSASVEDTAPEALGSYRDPPDPDLLYGDLAKTEEYRLIRRLTEEKLSMLELSQELGISVSACKKRVQRAREFLRRRLRL